MKTLMLTPNTNIDDRSNVPAVAYAAAALRRDLEARLGFADGGPAKTTITLYIEPNANTFDAHSIRVAAEGITISGSDELGLIHGIYAFSEKWLGSDPCQWITGIVPERIASVEIPCGACRSKPYTFRHRGWFFNDEDLLVGFQMEKPEHGFSMEVWQALFECALRMHCTCVIPGTNIVADEPQIELASDMGLYIAQHHAEPLGSCPMLWPRGVPFSWSTSKEFMIDWWRRAIKRQAGKKVLWTLGFRGLADRPFWVDDPNLAPDAPIETKAAIINEALATQYRMICEIRGEKAPETFGYLWGENYGLYDAGLLRFPEGTTIVHADGGNGCMAGNLEEMVGRSDHPTGVYQHISMFTGALSVRVTSYAPRTYAREIKRAVEAGMTEIFIVNVGNLREKTFNLRQVMGYANDYAAMAETCGADGDGYFAWFAREILKTGETRATQVYRNLTELPFRLDDENPESKFGDNIYTNIVRYSLQRIYNREDEPPAIFGITRAGLKTLPDAMDWFIDKLAAVAPKWELAAAQARDNRRHLAGAPLRFYEQDGLAQIEKVAALNAMALAFCRSARHYLAGDGYDAYLEAFQALRHCDAALAVEKQLDTGKFANWHRNDLNCRTWKCRQFLEGWHRMLDHLRWMNLDGMAEGPQPVYLQYKYNPNFKTAYREDLPLLAER